MLFEYDVVTGIIWNGICSRELRGNNVFDSKPQFCLVGDNGKPARIPANHAVKHFRDSDISMEYLMHIKGSDKKPFWKFLLKDGKPVKIVPIAGAYPSNWRFK